MKGLVKSILAVCGLKIQQIDTPMRSLDRGLDHLSGFVRPDVIVDIGVANGTPELYRSFPAPKYSYVLIEADPSHASALARLKEQLGAEVVQVFCGAQEGVVTLHSQQNGEYSSAYESQASRSTTDVRVPVRTLDSILENCAIQRKKLLLKIDVEGAEMDVLRGAVDALKHTVAAVIETSIAVKYKTGAEFSEVVQFMKEHGFSVFDLLAGANKSGKLYQVDTVFVRTDAEFRHP